MLLVFPLWSYGTIIIASSFMVMIAWHHCCYFFHGCDHLVPSLLLLLPSWSWFCGAIIATSFGVMISGCHHCYFLRGYGRLVSSLLLLFFSWSWSLSIIIVIASFMIMTSTIAATTSFLIVVAWHTVSFMVMVA